VKEQAPHITLVEHQGSIFKTLGEVCEKRGITEVAFEEDHVTYSGFHNLQKDLGSVVLKPIKKIVETLRMVKDEDELSFIRQASEIADHAFSRILEVIQPGMKEKDVALKLEFFMRERGASSSSFDIIVASGKRSALPHGIASEKELEIGDLITLDFGALYRGYASDITRTIMLGTPNQRQEEIYNIVLTAQMETIDKIRPGMTGVEADHIAREVITNRGYGEFFGHGTGHGLGSEVHEDPRLSKQGKIELIPGMVVTVEPGIYLPDFGGVRIEDDILITEMGCEVLTKSKKELIVIH
jgi:Xaa-Pro aminopeptidase